MAEHCGQSYALLSRQGIGSQVPRTQEELTSQEVLGPEISSAEKACVVPQNESATHHHGPSAVLLLQVVSIIWCKLTSGSCQSFCR